MDKPVLLQWIFDTRAWFPEATQTRQLETHPLATRLMALLPPAERAAALRYYHVRDANMALASSLLKHLALAQLLPSLPWHATCVSRDPVTSKPVFRPPPPPPSSPSSSSPSPETSYPEVSFNVTHQAGIVALIAARSPPRPPGGSGMKMDVGVDIVCTSERRARDLDVISTEGWAKFVDMHADVFSPRETAYLKHQVLAAVPGLVPTRSGSAQAVAGGGGGSEAMADAKLRAFYALWALREAYVKLTGDALLAAWLRELEFRGFRPVAPTAGWDVPAREEEEAVSEGDGRGPKKYGAQVINDFEIYLQGKRVEDVNISLRAMGPDFMICTAVRTPDQPGVGLGLKLRPYRVLDLEDMLDFAEARIGESEGSWP